MCLKNIDIYAQIEVFLSTTAQFPFLGWISNPLATVDSSVKGTNIRDCLQITLHWIQMLTSLKT